LWARQANIGEKPLNYDLVNRAGASGDRLQNLQRAQKKTPEVRQGGFKQRPLFKPGMYKGTKRDEYIGGQTIIN